MEWNEKRCRRARSSVLDLSTDQIEHQRPGGEIQPLKVPEWKWDEITMDFVSALQRTRAGYEVV